MKKVIIGTIIFLYSGFAYSYGAIHAKVNSVRVDRNGLGIIEFEAPIGKEPASCRSESYTSHFSFDTNSEGGKAIYSMALAATVSGKKVIAYGTGTCLEYSNLVESMNYGYINRQPQ